MTTLTPVQDSSSSKAFVITQSASKFESLVAQYEKVKRRDEKDLPQEIKIKIKMQEDAIKAARTEAKYKEELYNKQCEFEKQRADEEYEEYLDSCEQ